MLNFFYNLCLKNGKRVDNYYELTVDLSQKAIAKITGTHYVTVCKLLAYLRNEGIMEKKGKDVKIYDLDKLRDLIEDEQLKY
ncbi:helix-turn-helix domain-containing protein [Desulfitobacterium sp.]|uniref:helix-turn-helix domain-containing protein n=1 Tax=Desulfitobacterium sp. TaxID=49981 RepID=UPI002B21EF72|nr:helix-turn-helix domain-containing protein [Desulfitobacterium sp.]MEA4901609.1 helix-turn-helix domain-containing protein [Desulfitobacterium sp.]